ncbi:multidrug transporter [Paenibacillus crassostreae]|uniref:Multidrug transporter n=1 Tax=Paenibacillus crassostreae TaxID=1763538 RepID=A0A167AVZ3_9BACL|nr:MFS transporter [Paenibacillus crassostreae]OAB71498.1 multidrug transporter [Paenibacillus crassostreae]
MKPLKKSWLVYGIIFFSFIDLFAQLPVISTFATSVGATAFVAGIVVGMYSFSNTFGNILSGVLTDKVGPFKILVFGLITTSLSLLSYHLIYDTTSLLIVRCVHGFFGGLIVPAAFTLLANTTAQDKLGSKSAVTGSFIGIAAIIGPAFSGILASRTTVPTVFTFVAVFGLILTVTTFLFLRIQINKDKKVDTGGIFEWNKGVLKSFGGAFFLMFSQGVLAYLLPLHVESLGYSSRMSGTLMSMFGIIAVLAFVLPTNRIFDKVPSVYTLLIGVSLLGCSQMLLGQSETTLTLYTVMAIYGLGFAFLFPSINTLLIQSTKNETRGKAYGYFYAFFSLGVVVGSSLLGMLPFDLSLSFIFTGTVLVCFGILVITDTMLERLKLHKA